MLTASVSAWGAAEFLRDLLTLQPREAVFTAICRKNFGCTHFIVGRDHTGIGNHDPEDASKDLFVSLGDIGIRPVFMERVPYSESLGEMVEQSAATRDQDLVAISGIEVRERLLQRRLRNGEPVFVDS